MEKPINAATPVVSVCVQTYQQVQFIRQCLDGILQQQTTFDFELIIGEDESNDGTREVCMEFAQKFPDRIRLFLRSRKDVIYINGQATGRFNFLENLKASRGRYIALCEGDDYWTDPLKLQKQVNSLQNNPTYSAVFTDLIHIDFAGNLIGESRRVPVGYQSIDTTFLLQTNAIHTSTILFKKEIINEKVNDFIRRMPYGDMSLYLIASLSGNIGYTPDITSAYRVNVGVTSTMNKALLAKNSIFIRESFLKEFDNGKLFRDQFKIGLKRYYLDMCKGEFRNGNFLVGMRIYFLFWSYSVYRIFPSYPVYRHIGFWEHFSPIREILSFFARLWTRVLNKFL